MISLAAVLVVALTGGFFVYRHLEGNITAVDVTSALGTDRPSEVVPPDVEHTPMNVLLLGSDTREGVGNGIGGETPGLSDTTILLHLSANRDRAYGVSIPRDTMVDRPECERKDGQGTDPGGLSMFNAAYAVGGPACTIKTVESITDIRINHFVVVDFNGFKTMVDALGGVPVCIPQEVHDDIGNIDLPAGSYDIEGQQALNYVRLRHVLSENGDIGRMKRQQAFLAAMANKAISAGTLANPVRLYNFLDAATKSLTTDPELASLQKLAGLAKQLKDIGLEQIQFLTVPFETYEPDPNRLQLAPEAERLWKRLRNDEPLGEQLAKTVTTAADKPGGASKGPRPSGGASPSPSTGSSKSAEARAEQAAEYGLCA
ncbi:LCP family protein [Nocardioides mesophilus]|uniref:LCP family protein n=1 Tax=Nocardioides mesophilus TaxID=433659 RepID=A0A7G9R7I2_9ACTN|nr:LCP family protein [Nocardioides mesophilus]QNN51557.1 LCP family protein [Nocardioides mesophilus]